MDKNCPYCNKELPDEVARATASRQECPSCKKWFIVDEWDDIYPTRDNSFMCKNCGENLQDCECSIKAATKCDNCGGIVAIECSGECWNDPEFMFNKGGE